MSKTQEAALALTKQAGDEPAAKLAESRGLLQNDLDTGAHGADERSLGHAIQHLEHDYVDVLYDVRVWISRAYD